MRTPLGSIYTYVSELCLDMLNMCAVFIVKVCKIFPIEDFTQLENMYISSAVGCEMQE